MPLSLLDESLYSAVKLGVVCAAIPVEADGCVKARDRGGVGIHNQVERDKEGVQAMASILLARSTGNMSSQPPVRVCTVYCV